MYQKIQNVTLKSNETAEVGVLSGPDTSNVASQMRTLLGHKGPAFFWQVEQSLSGDTPGVDNRFYIIIKDGRPVANIMTVTSMGIGVFGHVFTVPEERRKGAADIILHHLMDDFTKRGGRAMYLGTGYDSHPYHLYAKYGFKGAQPESGAMLWFADGQEKFESEVFRSAPTRQEELSFKHWPTLPALAMMKHPAMLRILSMHVTSISSTEGGSLDFISPSSDVKEKGAAWVSVSESSKIPMAIATRRCNEYFHERVDLIDLLSAPGFEGELPKLFEKLQSPPARSALCYVDPFWTAKRDILKKLGFEKTGTLKAALRLYPKGSSDVEIWMRAPQA